MLRSLPLLCLLLAGLLSGCATTEPNTEHSLEQENQQITVVETENAREEIQWPGTYQGILPCAACEGVSTMLVIRPDMTYSTRTRMLGIDNKDRTASGKFRWLPDNSAIVLDGKEQQQVFRIYDGLVELRLLNGDAIPTQHPELYRLIKTD